MRVLLAGIEHGKAAGLAAALGGHGFEVSTLASFEDVWTEFQREPRSLIVVDVERSTTLALELAGRVRSLPAGEAIGLLAWGRLPADVAQRVIDAGFTGWLNPSENAASQVLRARFSFSCAQRRAERREAIERAAEAALEHESALEALRRSEARYRAVVEDQTELVCRSTADGIITFVNQAYCRYFGLSAGELIGRSFFTLVPESEHGAIRARIAGLGRQRPSDTYVHRVVADAGATRWQQWTDRAVFDDQGAVAEIQSVGRDVTELKQAEHALRESEEKYRKLVERSPLGILIAAGMPPKVVFANRAISSWLGLSPDDLHDMPAERLWALTHPEDRELFFARYAKAIESGLLLSGERVRVVRGDGETRCLEVYSGPVDYMGERAVQAVFVDATERLKMEEALRDSEEKYRRLADDSLQGMMIFQGEPPRAVYANKAAEKQTGWTKDELLAAPPGALFALASEQDRPTLVKNYAARLSGEPAPSRYELRGVRKDGSPFWAEVFASMIDFGGSPALQMVTSDLTDRKAAEEERRRLETRLLHAQKLESLGVLAGGIAHDFNNLLMGVLGNADLALLEFPPDSKARYNLLEIKAACRRLADLTQQMLAYAGKARLSTEDLDIAAIVEEMARLLRASIPRNVEIRFSKASGIPAMEGDPTQIRQVVMNLMTNAAEAIDQKPGIIEVRTELVHADRETFADSYMSEELPPGMYVCLVVRDNGSGMDEATKSRLFEPFFTTKFAGRGLGLSAVLGIVRGHRGSIQVKSDPGVGTSFRILFPALHRPPQTRTRLKTLASEWKGKGCVLVADDEPGVRDVTCRMLQRAGFTAIPAADGEEAVDIFIRRRSEIVLVVLDLTMPRMDGLASSRKIRELAPDVPVVLLSGYSADDVMRVHAKEGFAGFIQKPFDYDRFVDGVRRALGGAKPSGGRPAEAASDQGAHAP